MKNMFDVEGKTVFITGSSRGLGYTFAEGFLKAGAYVIVCARSVQSVNAAVDKLKKISAKVHGFRVDVSDTASVNAALNKAIELTGRLDVLINNAGIQDRASFLDMTPEQFQNVININLNSVFLVSQAAASLMKKLGGGSIINISSMTTYGARPDIANYSAAKSGVNALTRSMAIELAQYNIRTNAIAPGFFLTDMTQKLSDDDEFDSWVKSKVALKRWGKPEELVGAAIYLASEASGYMTGQVLLIDGGWRASL